MVVDGASEQVVSDLDGVLLVLRISLGDLLDGFSCSGSLDEMRQVERGLTGALDGLAAQMAAGSAFTNGELIIFAPGSRRKKDEADGGTPPSDWRN